MVLPYLYFIYLRCLFLIRLSKAPEPMVIQLLLGTLLNQNIRKPALTLTKKRSKRFLEYADVWEYRFVIVSYGDNTCDLDVLLVIKWCFFKIKMKWCSMVKEGDVIWKRPIWVSYDVEKQQLWVEDNPSSEIYFTFSHLNTLTKEHQLIMLQNFELRVTYLLICIPIHMLFRLYCVHTIEIFFCSSSNSIVWDEF